MNSLGFRNENALTRRRAIYALGQFGKKAQDSIPTLSGFLGDRTIGTIAAEALSEILNEPHSSVVDALENE